MTDKLSLIAEPLINWFDRNCRSLPWRRDREPYHVWISEIMLQQTRIEAVMRYYERFMDALPDVNALAQVDDDTLLKLWEGLGYYSRARNLKKAAQVIVNEYGGTFPKSCDELRKLPGIGEYTAGAIASICYDEKVPAVDGNVLRVVARLTGSRENVLLPQVKRDFSERLRAIMPDRAGRFNEGLMELGELVCLPNGAPYCERCPLSGQCTAFKENLTGEIPVRIKTSKRRREDRTILLLRTPDDRLALEKRPASGLLAGMYQLPNLDGFLDETALTKQLTEWGLVPENIRFTKEMKHVFTHIDWYMKGYEVTVKGTSPRFLWVTREERERAYPLPAAFQKML